MKIIAMIPARYAATRFPAKLMQILGNKTVIRHVYDATRATKLFDEVIVITDSDLIYNEVVNHEGKAMMSKRDHERRIRSRNWSGFLMTLPYKWGL
jgi:3-deoxy-manno-octulosonate cytidylyltransferase (CMP-KDO synthetase)